MNDIKNIKKDTNARYLFMTLIMGFSVVLMIPLSQIFALPPDPGYSNGEGRYCNDLDVVENDGYVTCCWFEEPSGNPGGTLDRYCQTCKSHDGNTLECDQKELQFKTKQPASEDSVFPTEDGKAVDDQQPNPSSPLTDQRVLPNEGVLEQSDDSPNNQGNSENIPFDGGVLRE